MKSNKASVKGVSQETYCRHGFHEWVRVAPRNDYTSSDRQPVLVLKCKHCGRMKQEK